MIITRDIINKNIKFHDVKIFADKANIMSYTFDDLSKLIDNYKNLIEKNFNVDLNNSAVIAEQLGFPQIAFIFACAELGIDIRIVDHVIHDGKLNQKVKPLLPVTYLLLDSMSEINNTNEIEHPDLILKVNLLKDHSAHFILTSSENANYNVNDKNLAIPNTTFLSCLDNISGKIIKHTHEFMSALTKRNSKMLYGKVGLFTNLNHGSSLAAYFLPSLASEDVTDLYYFHIKDPKGKELTFLLQYLESQGIKINHLMFPYAKIIDDFFIENYKATECILYTLSTIKNQWVKFVNTNVKDIISIFGTSEISGPLLINKASNSNFKEYTFEKVDDFYGVSLINNKLKVTLPIYNKSIIINDTFKIEEDRYVHLSYDQYSRINDLVVDLERYNTVLNTIHNNFGELIIDTINNDIYLALWKDCDYSILKTLDEMMRKETNNLHFVSKYAILRKEDFIFNNDINRNAIRTYFRRMPKRELV